MQHKLLELVGKIIAESETQSKEASKQMLADALIALRKEHEEGTSSLLDLVLEDARSRESNVISMVDERAQQIRDETKSTAEEQSKELADNTTELKDWLQSSMERQEAAISERSAEISTLLEGKLQDGTDALEKRISGVYEQTEASCNEVSEKADDAIEQLRRDFEEHGEAFKSFELSARAGIQSEIEEAITRVASALASVQDGEDGRDGQDRPIVEPAILKSGANYTKNTVGTWNGGLWVCTRDTSGSPEENASAWTCVLDGFTGIDIEQKDLTDFGLTVRLSSGEVYESEFTVPFLDHVGKHEEGVTYRQSAIVTKGSAWFKANCETATEPPGDDWEQILVAKRGPRGFRGLPGKKAEFPPGFFDELRELAQVPAAYLADLKELATKAFQDGRSDAYAITSYRGYFSPDETYRAGDMLKHLQGLYLCTSSGRYSNLTPDAFEQILVLPSGNTIPYMLWKGVWEPGTYSVGHVVRDNEWTMVAIRKTSERAGPQPVGEPSWASELGDTPAWENRQSSAVKEIVYGQRYTFAQSGYLNSARFYVDEATPEITYALYAITSPGQPNETLSEILSERSYTTTGWKDVPASVQLFPEGFVFDLYVAKRDRATSVKETYNYSYSLPQNPSIPGPGQIIHSRSSSNLMSVSEIDNDGQDRRVFLEGLVSGDNITGAGVQWTIISAVDGGNYFDFEVTPAVNGVEGVGGFDFISYTATPIDYVAITDHYAANSAVQGFYSENGLAGVTFDQDAYGVDIFVQEAILPSDWEVVAKSETKTAASASVQSNWLDERATPVINGYVVTQSNGWETLIEVPVSENSARIIEFYVSAKRVDEPGYFTGKYSALISRNGGVDVNLKKLYEHTSPGLRVRMNAEDESALIEVDGAANEVWEWRASLDLGDI